MFQLYHFAAETDEEEIYFDLSRTEGFTPFGVIMLTSTILACFKRGKQCTYIRPNSPKLEQFFYETGFYDFFKMKGKPNVKDLIKTKNVQLRRCQGLDYEIIDRLTQLFDHHLNLSSGVLGSLRMSLQETMTNVISHSGVNEYLVCAYSYERDKLIRLCIADLGKGILKSLSGSQNYNKLTNDYEAIRKATDEGVSSRPGLAGLGLTHIKNFIKVNKGQMCIISGKGKVIWKYDHGKILDQKMETPFQGTIVKLLINIDKEGRYFLIDEAEYMF